MFDIRFDFKVKQHNSIVNCSGIHPEMLTRGYSSAGRALEWHSRGQRFDPAYLHHRSLENHWFSRLFSMRNFISDGETISPD